MKAPSPKPSLQTIADRASVSRATVSLALRNQACISVGTRQRIQRIAEEIGYRPNPLVSTLMAHVKSLRPLPDAGAIAFLTAFQERDAWRNFPSFTRYYDGASLRARQLGYHLDEMWLKEPGMTTKRMKTILLNRGVEGLLLAPLPSTGHFSLDLTPFAVATMGYSIIRPNLHRAVSNHMESLRTAMRHLRHLGYRRVGLAVHRSQDKRSNYNWSASYLAYQLTSASAAATIPIPIFFFDHDDEPEFGRWLGRWKPDAIISGNSDIVQALQRLKLSVPDDLGLAVLDRPRTDESIAGIDQQLELAGAASIDLIVGQLHRNERGSPAVPKLTLVGGIWVPGDSARKVDAPRLAQPPGNAKRSVPTRRPRPSAEVRPVSRDTAPGAGIAAVRASGQTGR